MKIIINFYANVSEQTVRDLIVFVTQQLAQQNQQKSFDELVLQISSSGGSSDHGLLAYNFLKQLSIKKTTIGMGNVDSAAIMLYCAGDNRIAMPSCRFVLHQAQATLGGQFNADKLLEMARLTKRITDDYSDVVSKVAGKSKKTVRQKINKGTVISSDEAKNIGLVHNVTDEPYIKELKDTAIFIINNPIINPNLPGLEKKAEI